VHRFVELHPPCEETSESKGEGRAPMFLKKGTARVPATLLFHLSAGPFRKGGGLGLTPPKPPAPKKGVRGGCCKERFCHDDPWKW